MELEVRDREKRVHELYKEYKAKKYLVGVFASGTEDLKGLTCDLLRYNRVRLRELETKNEKAVGFER